MRFDELVAILKKRYNETNRGKALEIHLFAIEFADELEEHSLLDISKAALGTYSYHTELNKGKNIAPYVTLKT